MPLLLAERFAGLHSHYLSVFVSIKFWQKSNVYYCWLYCRLKGPGGSMS